MLQPAQELGLGNGPASPGHKVPPFSSPTGINCSKTGIKETDAASPKAMCFGKTHFKQCWHYKVTFGVTLLPLISWQKYSSSWLFASHLCCYNLHEICVSLRVSTLVRAKCYVYFLPALWRSADFQWIQTLIFIVSIHSLRCDFALKVNSFGGKILHSFMGLALWKCME